MMRLARPHEQLRLTTPQPRQCQFSHQIHLRWQISKTPRQTIQSQISATVRCIARPSHVPAPEAMGRAAYLAARLDLSAAQAWRAPGGAGDPDPVPPAALTTAGTPDAHNTYHR